MRWIISYSFCLFLWLPGKINAQQVIYSDPGGMHASSNYQVIGKSGNFYWIEKLKKTRTNDRYVTSVSTEIQGFALFDDKLRYVREVPAIHLFGTRKQWLAPGENGLDQVIVTNSGGKTRFFKSHYRVGDQHNELFGAIDSLPFTVNPSALVLVRSENHSRSLLLAFDHSDIQLTRMHIILLDADWKPIYHRVISSDLFSQPFIQDEEIGFPSESFDNLPIKLADNGEWTMVSSSRKTMSFSILHFSFSGDQYYFKEFPGSAFYQTEDIAMSIDNEKDELGIGILSAYYGSSFKCVRTFTYSMKEGKFIFDSSYRFNEQLRDIQSKNLSHESFVAVPRTGYILLKEYGLPFEFKKPAIPALNNWETEFLLTNYSEGKTGQEQIKNGYTFNRGLSPIRSVLNPGDLNLFYFPSVSKDSAWSGILDIEQHTESNNPDLSYLLIPWNNKLYVIYNSEDRSSDAYATTTALNLRGQVSDGGVIFWKINKMLNFQNSRRFTDNEIAVPYLNRLQSGFAIIRL